MRTCPVGDRGRGRMCARREAGDEAAYAPGGRPGMRPHVRLAGDRDKAACVPGGRPG